MAGNPLPDRSKTSRVNVARALPGRSRTTVSPVAPSPTRATTAAAIDGIADGLVLGVSLGVAKAEADARAAPVAAVLTPEVFKRPPLS